MLNSFYCFFDSLKPTGPFKLIQTANIGELEKRLQHGLNPDTKSDNGYTLLSIAIEYDQPRMITLLLQYGANPNDEMLISDNKQFAIDRGFCTRKHGIALMRLLLTYGTHYTQIWDNVRQYYNSREYDAFQMVTWMDEQKEECYKIYNLQKDAQRLFNMHQYTEAKMKYEEAASMLTRLAEKDKKDRENASSSNDRYMGRDAYYDDYCVRTAQCKTMVRTCDQRLERQEVSSERDPLLLENKKTV